MRSSGRDKGEIFRKQAGKEKGQIKKGKEIEENDRMAEEKKDAVHTKALFYFYKSTCNIKLKATTYFLVI